MSLLPLEEKRQTSRYNCEAKVRWSNFGQPMDGGGRITNFSKNGICFTTKIPLKPGATVWYCVDQFLSGCWARDPHECLRTISVANTKWCLKVTEDSENKFIIGLKYQ
jgi:hypothetical protein